MIIITIIIISSSSNDNTTTNNNKILIMMMILVLRDLLAGVLELLPALRLQGMEFHVVVNMHLLICSWSSISLSMWNSI